MYYGSESPEKLNMIFLLSSVYVFSHDLPHKNAIVFAEETSLPNIACNQCVQVCQACSCISGASNFNYTITYHELKYSF